MNVGFARRIAEMLGLLGLVLCISACGGGGGSNPSPAPPAPPNTQPTVNAGPDQTVREGGSVQLAGSGSDAEGAVTYAWTQVSGPTITLNDATLANPTFDAPMVNANTTVELQLTVTDSAGATASDSMVVTIQNVFGNTPPSANAGPDQTVAEGSTVQLAGSGTDAESTVTLQWQQVSGPGVVLSDTTATNATFIAPQVTAATDVVLRLTVTDVFGATASDDVRITINDVSPTNTPPTANAGADQSVDEGANVQLSGSGSDAEGAVTFAWTQVSGPSVALSNAAAGNPTFTAPQVSATTPIVLQLTVTDADGVTATAAVTITVNDSTPGAGSYNRRVHIMRYDFDNNGTYETVNTYTYNPDGSVATIVGAYTDDGTPDVDLISFNLGAGATSTQNDSETQTFSYTPEGRLELWTLQSPTDRSELNFTWHANDTVDTAMFDNFDGTGALVSRINFTTTYTNGQLSNWQGTSPQNPSFQMSVALTYDGSGVLASDLKTTNPGNSRLQRDFTWTPSGAIDFIHDFNPAGSYDATTDFVYVSDRAVKKIHTLPRQLYSWNYAYTTDGLLEYQRVDLDDNGSIEAVVQIEWETGACRDVTAWAPQTIPSPLTRLSDPRAYTLGDGHFKLPMCATVP